MKDLPCKDFKLPPLKDFTLEKSPCRKCTLSVCPFDQALEAIDKKLGNLYEYLGIERGE